MKGSHHRHLRRHRPVEEGKVKKKRWWKKQKIFAVDALTCHYFHDAHRRRLH